MAAGMGFEPIIHGTKNRCITDYANPLIIIIPNWRLKMIEFAKVFGRLLGVLISKGLIDCDDAFYIAEPLKALDEKQQGKEKKER